MMPEQSLIAAPPAVAQWFEESPFAVYFEWWGHAIVDDASLATMKPASDSPAPPPAAG